MSETLSELKAILDQTSQSEEETDTIEKMLKRLQDENVSNKEISKIAHALINKFYDLNEQITEAFLPRVGAIVGAIVENENSYATTITKVEKRTDKNNSPFWVIGIDFGSRGTASKTVFRKDKGNFKVSWRVREGKFLSKIVPGKYLINELGRNVFNF